MKYFIINENKKITNIPQIINWTKVINPLYLKYGDYHKIAKRNLINIKSDKSTIFPDLIFHPFFLISKEVKEVLDMFEPNQVYKEVVLLDGENELMKLYYLPVLREYNCMAEGTEYNLDKSIIRHGILDTSKIEDKCIFKVANVKNSHIIARLDFVESILRRGFIIDISELEII